MTRLKEIRKDFNLSQLELAKKIGRSQTTISDIEKERYPMEKVTALAIEATLGINANWLLTGEGPKYKKGTSKANIKNQSDLVWASSQISPNDEIVGIPILGTVPGKLFIKDEKNTEEIIELSKSILPKDFYNVFALKVEDDSMLHSVKRGSIVIINEQSEVKNGEIALVLYGNEISLKKYYLHKNNIILRSDNPSYKDIIIPREDEDEVEILGKLILSISTWSEIHYLKSPLQK
jgi:repressor LexA